MKSEQNETAPQEVAIKPRRGRKPNTTNNTMPDVKQLKAENNLLKSKVEELTRIVESMKGQLSKTEQHYNNILIKNKAKLEYVIDCIKHAYIASTMTVKEEN